MDIWSSKSRASYLCITVHYIIREDSSDGDGALALKSSILAFHRLGGDHSGKNISKAVTALLIRAGVDPTQVCYYLFIVACQLLTYEHPGSVLDHGQCEQQ